MTVTDLVHAVIARCGVMPADNALVTEARWLLDMAARRIGRRDTVGLVLAPDADKATAVSAAAHCLLSLEGIRRG